jgi:hypothetical protein
VANCVAAGLSSIKANMVVKVVDDNQTPIEGAQVTGSFRNYPANTLITCTTDKDGVCLIKGDASFEGSVLAEKEGYYYSSLHFEFEKENRIIGRYEPWGKTYQVILKKKRNPVPMYAKRIQSMKVPATDTPIGYDLEVGDWVAPHGNGKINDFIFLFHHEESGQKDYKSSFELTFSKELDGIQGFQFDSAEHSIYKWPYNAPMINYKKSLSKYISKKPHDNVQSNVSDEINYIFRVRTKVDENGNIISARYGKILGDVQIGIKLIGFTYYFNPDGTKNLEFDPKRNLFKFSRDEFLNEVKRP